MIIELPVITEKSLRLAEDGVYTFMVKSNATKPEIAKAVARLYAVTVSVVRVQSVTGSSVTRRIGGKTTVGQKKSWKKALVTLEKGQQIKDFQLKEMADESKTDKADKTDKAVKNEKKVS